MLKKLIENSSLYIQLSTSPRERYFYKKIDHIDKLIGIIGARGVVYFKLSKKSSNLYF